MAHALPTLQAMELLQNVMEEMKTLKEAQEKAQERVQELLELSPQVRAPGYPPHTAPLPCLH